MPGLLPRDEVLHAASEALLAEVERALAQAERAAANELLAQADTPAGPVSLSPADWEARFAQITDHVTRLHLCVEAIREEANQMDHLLLTEQETLAAWVQQARQSADTLAEWAGDTV